MNNWFVFLVIAAIVIFVVVVRRTGELSRESAAALLDRGALVIDVRSPEEFATGHLARAINLPLNGIETALPARGVGLHQVVLLHCQSGMRSAMAKKKLQGVGYTQVFNLGSYARAREIVDGAGS